MRTSSLAAFVLVLLGAGCVAPTERSIRIFSSAEIAGDFASYEIRRVGLVPVAGEPLTAPERKQIQEALSAELSRSTSYELVLLQDSDLEALEPSEPHRRGWYRPRTILGLARRHHLDGILFGTVTSRRFFEPQAIGLEVELVAAETGLAIWSASVYLDAADPEVQAGFERYYEGLGDWRTALLSAERFARFAAFQVAALL
jgi:hypothetical protein